MTPTNELDRRERARRTALEHRPWRFSTGPRTPHGKAISRRNALQFGLYIVDPGVEPSAGVALVRLARAVLWYSMADESKRHRRLADLRGWLARCLELTPGEPFVRQMRDRFGGA